MEKKFFDDFQIDKNDYKEDFAKCDKLTADLQVEKFDFFPVSICSVKIFI